MSATLILAEKPSVARDIAKVVGALQARPGFLEGNGYVVSWAIGHLVSLPEPQDISPDWKIWRAASLPMIPEKWPLKVVEATRDQFQVVKKLLGECRDVICATDAGREGELIFRYIYEAARCRKPVRRLWISSLTAQAIRRGMESLKEGAAYDSLADAARGRSRADWLVGMNLSRAYTLTFGDRYFVGRVQTPTLSLVVARDEEISQFKPEDYFEVEAQFGINGESYRGFYLGEMPVKSDGFARAKRLPPDGELAGAIVGRVTAGRATVPSVESKDVRQPPPLLYDLTELQRHANRLFGFSAAKTLQLAQALYEKHKLISYPRTDSSHLSQNEVPGLKAIVDAISGPYRADLKPDTGTRKLGIRYVDDSKVTDHHAILPTDVRPPGSLLGDEKNIYDLICRRLLALWQGDYVTGVTTVLTEVNSSAGATRDLFKTLGIKVIEFGWKILDPESAGGSDREKDKTPLIPKSVEKHASVDVKEAKPLRKTTRPPPHLNDASLLSAMETAGRNLEDRELQRAMRESGLGTPATRAGIIETLLTRGYLERRGKQLVGTDLGKRLIATVHPSVKSPELTGKWERELGQIQAGKRSLTSFIDELEAQIRERVSEVLASPGAASRAPVSFRADPIAREPESPPPSSWPSGPTSDINAELAFASSLSASLPLVAPPFSSSLPPSSSPFALSGARRADRDRNPKALLASVFGFPAFREHQEAVCRAVIAGRDVLLVMPTGAGKSLCYQLPGLALGGTTLVVSPLVALIDDQVEKLKLLGLAGERIHSGRKREESREVCHRYLEGKLDYLFIAPERLGVPGFAEMLRKRPLSLIAIDEAHCISHWGHDFRPEYRLLGERLGDFRPTPVIALTATATPLVQADIVGQLGLKKPMLSIHGFRRTNIAIQLAELPPSARVDAIVALLEPEGRRPAIVYAPTRKVAESLAESLKMRFRAEAYHAGMAAGQRERVQEKYLRGDLEVMVATIAFGMGIDKANVRTVIHAALPGSVEGYYQEIGRAGRDGKDSLAVLFHSFADRKTHEFFFEKSYPDADTLKKIYRKINAVPKPKETLRAEVLGIDDGSFDNALEKLWIHKGAFIDPEENVRRGIAGWENPYAEQREHRLAQLRQIVTFADSSKCRMLYLISHFGDQNDRGERCGICDLCAPETAKHLIPIRPFSQNEKRLAAHVMAAVAKRSDYPTGRLHSDLAVAGVEEDRRDFEKVVAALVREGWLDVKERTFQKEGKTIAFRTLTVTASGKLASGAALENLNVPDSVATKSAGKRRKKTKKPSKSVPRKTPVPSGNESQVFEALRLWRLAEARKKRLPAFRILTDAVLHGIAEAQPSNESELLEVKGMGPALVGRYKEVVLGIVNSGL